MVFCAYISGLVTISVRFECDLLQIGNVRLKNADGMPVIMLLGSLMCCSCWLVYGVMLSDPNIYVRIYFNCVLVFQIFSHQIVMLCLDGVYCGIIFIFL